MVIYLPDKECRCPGIDWSASGQNSPTSGTAVKYDGSTRHLVINWMMTAADDYDPSQPFHMLFIFTSQPYLIIGSMINKAHRFDRKSSMTGVITPLSVFTAENGEANLRKGEKKMERKTDSDCGEGRHGGFRHLLPLLAIPLAIGLMRGVAHHKFTHMGEQRRAEWKNGVPPMFAELHRRAHVAEAEKPVETQA